MQLRRPLWTMSLLGWLALTWAQGYEDDTEDIMPSYVDNYYNEISEGEIREVNPSTAPPTAPKSECKSIELTKWDKLFTMLENSQMKENMLLQYSDDIMKVELQALRTEMLQFAARYNSGSGCAGPQLELRLQQALEQLRESAGQQRAQQEAVLQQLLAASRSQTGRLAKLESTCLGGKASGGVENGGGGANDSKGFLTRHLMQETASPAAAATTGVMSASTDSNGAGQLQQALDRLTAEVRGLREQMERQLLATAQSGLPAGCDSAVFIPMHSPETYAQLEQRNVQMSALTVCLWARPTQVLNKTVLLSYGGAWNPVDVQLVLSGRGALFTVGGEAHLVEAAGVVGERRWTHLCGTWSSEQGLASLWVDGRQVASAPGVAEGNTIPGSGVLQLGKEGSRQRRGTRPLDSEAVAVAHATFTGKITGVNVWDRTLSQEEISQQAKRNGSSCGNLGNVVAWGVTKMALRGEAKLVY
ncbi:hypothetical protein ACEWY4_008648 [Coilia grayii]|uniref:Pentraxin (PTX) domain-containing protein n=1 Tax=Coilia grayii TaxID=363190 RepID=A0ABD1KBL2_9TELE